MSVLLSEWLGARLVLLQMWRQTSPELFMKFTTPCRPIGRNRASSMVSRTAVYRKDACGDIPKSIRLRQQRSYVIKSHSKALK
jgi:hypothetical protein